MSVFDADLGLLADSDLGSGPLDTVSDRRRRTEVAGALLRVSAASRRPSLLDGRDYLFSAARVYWEGESVVIRFGDPADPIRDAAARVANVAGAGVLAAGLVVLILAQRALRSVTGSLGEVRRLLARLAAGRPPGPRVRLPGITELARLTSAANRVRAELEEQVARVSRDRDELADLMDEVTEGLMALTSDARILRSNPAARDLLGLAEVPPFAPVASVVRDPVLRDLLEASVIRPEGRLEVTVGDRELEVRTRMGTEGGSMVLLVDITELRRLEAVRSDFVANASHELKTPLTVIRAAAETVLDEGLPPDLKEKFLRSIEGNTVRLQRLVDDLLDLSRYESGVWRPECARLSVEVVTWSAWEEQEAKAVRRGVGFDGSGGRRVRPGAPRIPCRRARFGHRGRTAAVLRGGDRYRWRVPADDLRRSGPLPCRGNRLRSHARCQGRRNHDHQQRQRVGRLCHPGRAEAALGAGERRCDLA